MLMKRYSYMTKKVRLLASAILVLLCSFGLVSPMVMADVQVGTGSTITTSGWQTINGKRYFVCEGVLLKGEQTIEGSKYYFDPSSGAMRTGWVKLSNGRVVFQDRKNGKRLSGGEARIDGSVYYLEPSTGYRHSGWVKFSNLVYKWYDINGRRAQNVTRTVDGRSRTFDANGHVNKYGWQNPSQYFQASNWPVKFKKPSPWNYATPSRLQTGASRKAAIDQMIRRAMEYRGSRYVWDYALAPHQGVDCAGLVMQSLYATGMNLDGYNPYNHWYDPWHSHDANNMRADKRFKKVPVSQRQRGDLVFWSGHVAIYLGDNQVIEAYPPRVRVTSLTYQRGMPIAAARPFV